MAEIRVDNNRNNNNRSIWPWILGALLLIGLIWGVSALTGNDNDRTREANRVETTTPYDGEARPIEEERVRDDRYNENRTLEENRMRNDQMLEEDRMNDGTMDDNTMHNEPVRDEVEID
jgi:hypothetical protein